MGQRIVIGDGFDSITSLYDLVAKTMGITVIDNTRYACTKICVSQDIQDKIFDSYWEKIAISMAWLNYGPKAIEDLPYRTVEIEDGFIYEVSE